MNYSDRQSREIILPVTVELSSFCCTAWFLLRKELKEFLTYLYP